MLKWALMFFVLAIVSAVLGFGGLAGGLAMVAKILFFAFVVLLIVSLIANATRQPV